MSARATMTMRATVERDVTTDTDDWGTPDADDPVEVGVVPCKAWSKTKRESEDGGKTSIIEDMRARVPADADVQGGDRLVIRDRLGEVQFAGPVFVEAVARKGSSGSRASHQELMLTRHK